MSDPAYLDAPFNWPPVYDEAWADQLRNMLRPRYTCIDELSTPELMEFVASHFSEVFP
jgi:hypothetical protein